MKNIFVIPLMTVIFLAACASAPERSEQLEQASAQVQTLSQDPMAAQAASRELEAARNELSQAETALKQRKSQEEVNHLAYLAARHAEIGQARIAEARAREQIAQGEAERNRALLEARTREAEAAKREAQSMAQQLAALQAEQTQRGMVMTLSDVLFDTGAATLKPGADLNLDRLADLLRQSPQTRIIIEGHTDSRGSETYNEELSQRRGQAVADALASRGISGNRVQVMGRGEAYPVANNNTAAGRQQNRRVEIVFSDAAGRFAQGAADASLR